MNVALVLVAFDEKPYLNGYLKVGQKYLNDVTQFFPQIASLQIDSVTDMIGIYGPAGFDQKKAVRLKLTKIQQTNDQIQLWFTRLQETNLTSQEIKTRLRKWMRNAHSWDGKGFLPMIFVLPAEQLDSILHQHNHDIHGIKEKIKNLKQKYDWEGIYKLVEPFENLPNQPELWNDAEVLSELGFACSKLSELSKIELDMLRDEQKKKQILEQKAYFRRHCQKLFNRCIELHPNNPSYSSSLAYFHYKNTQELTQRSGRRDGNVLEEAKLAIQLFDKALAINPSRINDLYRKGFLLTQTIPNQMLFGKQKESTNEDRRALAEQSRLKGIECFESVIKIWEDLRNEETKKRYRKEYIKSIYYTGQTYYDLMYNVWDEAVYLYRLKSNQPPSDGHNPQDLERANKAWDYFYKCWQVDRSSNKVLSEQNLKDTPLAGIEEGVHRLYWLGKAAFAQYWVISRYGLYDDPKAVPFRERAIKFLQAALDLPYSHDAQNQRKDYIVELMARVLISQDQPQQAVKLIENKFKNVRDVYIQHTYALALILTGNYSKAHQLLEEAANNKYNPDTYTTALLMGCNYLYQGNLAQAKTAFTRGQKIAEQQGKVRIEHLLIGLALVAHQSTDTNRADELFYQASLLNPSLPIKGIPERWK